ncbi:membrane associated phosphatase [Escherichia coli]|nr:membrane associated phosphatase [Escherichia coli]
MLEKSLAILFALLILATLINRFLVWRLPERKGDEVTLRIRTWWGIVICFSLVISGPRWMTLTFFALIQPQGSNAFGRLIDKIYLNSVGWRGIRQRKTHLQILIKQAVADLLAKGLAVRVVDIAAGHGRYVLDALANEPAVSEILLRDYSEVNVAQGQEMIAQRGMSGRVRFEQGDAFNPEELSALTPRPTLAIVSGLYELFPENEQVKNSLAGLANAIDPGGILIYTGQPWHPQLELIAGVLTSHKDGKPWVMRVRSQGEMDSLVHDAGFDKCTQRIDVWGIFTVSMAVRRDN